MVKETSKTFLLQLWLWLRAAISNLAKGVEI